MTKVNLIPPDRRLARQRRLRTSRWITICTAYFALLIMASITSFARSNALSVRMHRIDSEAVSRRIESSQRYLGELQRQLTEKRYVVSTVESIGPQPDWSLLLTMLATVAGENVVLRSCELSPIIAAEEAANAAEGAANTPEEGFRLLIAGFGKSQADVAGFVIRLEKSALLDSVSLARSRREPFLSGQAISFDLTCTLGTEPEPAP